MKQMMDSINHFLFCKHNGHLFPLKSRVISFCIAHSTIGL